jgi:lysophospholipase L1-like esterase
MARLAPLWLVIGGAAMAVGLLEGLGTLLTPRTERARRASELRRLHEPRPDRPWLYGLRPGARAQLSFTGGVLYEINADGFRDRAYTRAKPPGTFRAVVLGDSVSFGHGVELEATFPKRLEALLAASAPSPAFQILNMGVNGYNPYNEAAVLEDIGVRYEPDLVLVQFCVNDLNDPVLNFDFSTQLALGAIPDAAIPDPIHRRPIPSVAARFCNRFWTCMTLRQFFAASPADSRGEEAAAFSMLDGSGPELAWLRARYTEMVSSARRAGATFAVVVFPYREQLTGPASPPLQRRLAALGRDAGLTIIDLLPAFRKAAARSAEPLFIDHWHPSAAGHRVAAEAILTALACRRLVPAVIADKCEHEK